MEPNDSQSRSSEPPVFYVPSPESYSRFLGLMDATGLGNRVCLVDRKEALPDNGDWYLPVTVPSLDLLGHPFDLIPGQLCEVVRTAGARLFFDLSIEAITFHGYSGEKLLGFHRRIAESPIPPDRIVLLTANSNAPEGYTAWCARERIDRPVKVLGYNFYLYEYFTELAPRFIGTGLCDEIETDAHRTILDDKLRPKYFTCLNLRPRWHRYAVALHLLASGHLDKGVVSFHGQEFGFSDAPSVDSLEHTIAEIEKLPSGLRLLGRLDELQRMAPLTVDQTPAEIRQTLWSPNRDIGFLVPQTGGSTAISPTRSYFEIVTETWLTDAGTRYITEKTLRPMLRLQPFVHVGTPGVLRELREMGFRTFHPHIDESYDEITDPHARLETIFGEIDRLCTLTRSELHELYTALWPAVRHNQRHYFHHTQEACDREITDRILARLSAPAADAAAPRAAARSLAFRRPPVIPSRDQIPARPADRQAAARAGKESGLPPLVSFHLCSNRPDGIIELFDNLEKTAFDHDCFEVVVKIDDTDTVMNELMTRETARRPFRIRYISTPRGNGYFSLWNALNDVHRACHPEAYFVCNINDEFRFRTAGWDSRLRNYVGFFADDIFRLRTSLYKLRNYVDFWENGFAPENYAFITKRWLDIVGGWCPCHGPDSFQQFVAYYLWSATYPEKSQYYRDVPIFDIEIGGEGAFVGLEGDALRRRVQGGWRAWYHLVGPEMQMEAFRQARLLQAHIMADEMGGENFETVTDPGRKAVLVVERGTGAEKVVLPYRLSRPRIILRNVHHALRQGYYCGGTRDKWRSLPRGTLEFLRNYYPRFDDFVRRYLLPVHYRIVRSAISFPGRCGRAWKLLVTDPNQFGRHLYRRSRVVSIAVRGIREPGWFCRKVRERTPWLGGTRRS